MIEYDCTFGTDRPGDPERAVGIMVATDSVQSAKELETSMWFKELNYIDRLGLVKAAQTCDQER